MLRRTAASTVSNLANFATINLKDDARQAGQVMVRPSTPPEAVPGGRHARSRLHWRRFARGRMGVVASAVKSIGITVVRGHADLDVSLRSVRAVDVLGCGVRPVCVGALSTGNELPSSNYWLGGTGEVRRQGF